ncbi:MAG TPA: fibronectin/fibrinogen-binding protein [Clostridiales bacterium]|nr:fibronectin/fibrinogen-binding protein [Clostridiales bacterium]
MALDGILLFGLARELNNILANGRVDKIQQPEIDEIHLTIRNKGRNYKLLLSASASHPRIHLTNQSKQNPMVPPKFCMVLRKHLSGGRFISVRQPGMERILEIDFEVINEIGDLDKKSLIIEIMGRHSNIIMTDSDGKILDAVKHVDNSVSRVREVLPGELYHYPPTQGKTDPLSATAEEVSAKFTAAEKENIPENILSNAYTGLSKITAKEICRIAEERSSRSASSTSPDEIAASFVDFISKVKDGMFEPTLLMDEEGKPKDVLPMPYGLFPLNRLKKYPTFSEALDDFFIERDKTERIQQRTAYLNRVIKNNLERCLRKLEIQTEELDKAKNAEMYRLYGELITANIYRIPPGIDEISVPDYYQPDLPLITIPLDRYKTPAQNAQNYFKLYNKAKTVLSKQSLLIQDTREEINYLESVAQNLSICENEAEILEIKDELIKEGYIRDKDASGKARKQQPASKPYRFISSDGFEILVGKNNIQNDHLTLKIASSHDIWLHTKLIQGSHVIIRTGGQPVPETTLLEAANLAAYYSKGRSSANVPVDYCPKKNVKKPSGAKPGMVIYNQYKTIYVTPSEEMVKSMKKLN